MVVIVFKCRCFYNVYSNHEIPRPSSYDFNADFILSRSDDLPVSHTSSTLSAHIIKDGEDTLIYRLQAWFDELMLMSSSHDDDVIAIPFESQASDSEDISKYEKLIHITSKDFVKLKNIIRSSQPKPSHEEFKPEFFYADHKHKHVFRIFYRQEQAFHYMDNELSAEQRGYVKVYSFETMFTGKRKFLVASFDDFISAYFTSCRRPEDRHFYEIIREGFPCRPYFDLEFAIDDGISDEQYESLRRRGDHAVEMWINLVLWKILEITGIALGYQHVVVLDSSTSRKFSKHVIILVEDSVSGKELFAANNQSIAFLVASIMQDITEEVKTAQLYPINNPDESHIRSPPLSSRRRPRPPYTKLWFESKDESRRSFIVDLGVYSRNRAFRLLGSCKFGKSTLMQVLPSDTAVYTGLTNAINATSASNLNEIRRCRLERSFVISSNLIKSYAYEIQRSCGHSDAQYRFHGAFLSFNFNANIHLNLARDFASIDEQGICGWPGFYSNTSTSMPRCANIVSPDHQSSSHSISTSSWKESLVLECRERKKSSPFPTLDDYVIKMMGCRGGIVGEINGWRLSCNRQRNPPVYRVRYQLLHNRWCSHVQRQHKSNGIMLEVDYMSASLYQLCWDPECRGYRSDAIPIPPALLPTFDMLVDLDPAAKEYHHEAGLNTI
jgi:hypothetical protein